MQYNLISVERIENHKLDYVENSIICINFAIYVN